MYQDPAYAGVIGELKAELKAQRERYNETDARYPHLEKIIQDHWDS